MQDEFAELTAEGCCPMLGVGSKGDCVRKVQRRLKRRHGAQLVVDGMFGPVTEREVKTFQRREGLQADGIVGDATYRALFGSACVVP